jgi:hypothetical protein
MAKRRRVGFAPTAGVGLDDRAPSAGCGCTTTAVRESASPMPVDVHPSGSGLHPASRHPAPPRPAADPVAGNPDVGAVVPAPVSAGPDVATCVRWRRAVLGAGRWRRTMWTAVPAAGRRAPVAGWRAFVAGRRASVAGWWASGARTRRRPGGRLVARAGRTGSGAAAGRRGRIRSRPGRWPRRWRGLRERFARSGSAQYGNGGNGDVPQVSTSVHGAPFKECDVPTSHARGRQAGDLRTRQRRCAFRAWMRGVRSAFRPFVLGSRIGTSTDLEQALFTRGAPVRSGAIVLPNHELHRTEALKMSAQFSHLNERFLLEILWKSLLFCN